MQPFVYRNGRMTVLDVRRLGGNEGNGHQINDKDQVIGQYSVSGDGASIDRVFIATPISLLLTRLIAHTKAANGGDALASRAGSARNAYSAEKLALTCSWLLNYTTVAAAPPVSTALGSKRVKQLTKEARAIREALDC